MDRKARLSWPITDISAGVSIVVSGFRNGQLPKPASQFSILGLVSVAGCDKSMLPHPNAVRPVQKRMSRCLSAELQTSTRMTVCVGFPGDQVRKVLTREGKVASHIPD